MADLTGQLQAAAGSAGGGGWDISTAVYDSGDGAWDLSKSVYSGMTFIATGLTLCSGVFFKPDGTRMYIAANGTDEVYEYTLSTPWVVNTATQVQSFSLTQDASLADLFFKPDGTKMYTVGATNDKVYEYSLSTAWDVSTISFVQDFSVATEETNPNGLFFKPDGTKMYICGATGDDVNEYSLSSAWDISTSSYVQNFSVATEETSPQGLFFKPDGTIMYVIGITTDNIFQYSLSTPWDISTASYASKSIASGDVTPTGVFFHPDGIAFYVIGSGGNAVRQYICGSFNLANEESQNQGIFFKPDGTKMYTVGAIGDDVNEYSLSTEWDILTASYVQNFSVASQETIPTGLFFKPDGTKMYVVGSSGDSVNEYSLSGAWDISTASYAQNFYVASQESIPNGVFFKDDGTKMYICGGNGQEVNEYTLSTAWDVSTASYVQNFSVASQDATPVGLFFKPSGTIMYVVGLNGDSVYEYNLSTPWDISTATYSQLKKLFAETGPSDLYIRDDGKKMFIVSNTPDAVTAYTLS